MLIYAAILLPSTGHNCCSTPVLPGRLYSPNLPLPVHLEVMIGIIRLRQGRHNRDVIKVYRRIGDTDVKSHDTHVKIHKNRLLRDVLTKNECIPVAACTQMCIL